MDFESSSSSAVSEPQGLLINVNGSDDPYYRYKMPALQVTVIDSKGGTTVIKNIWAVARALHRDVSDIKGHMQRDLSRSVKVKSDGLYINGCLTEAKLRSSLQVYIIKSILCEECGCPETHIQEGKGKKRVCSACGHKMID